MSIFYLILLTVFIIETKCQKAVVFWHGMGDFAQNPALMEFKEAIETAYPGVYVKSIQIGSNSIEDIEHGYLMNVNKQIDMVCKELTADKKLKNGFHAVGFSQGGQFLRGLVQRCSALTVFNLISIGGQHQGVYGFPKCPASLKVCEYAREMVAKGAYESFVQNHIVQAEYWHDPLKEQQYKQRSVFLADINQENSVNETYKRNLLRLHHLVLVLFEQETIVTPKQSEWFGFYRAGQDKDLVTMEETELYQQDKLGLKELKEQGRLHFLALNSDHLSFTFKWFKEVIIKEWLQ